MSTNHVNNHINLLHNAPKRTLLTIKDIGLDLAPGVGELIESIISFISQGTILNGSNHIDKNIILKKFV